MPLRALAVTSASGLDVHVLAKTLQVAQRVVADDHHVAAPTPVAAVGPALGHVRLAPEAQAAVAARSGGNMDLRPVVQHATILTTDVGSAGYPRAKPSFIRTGPVPERKVRRARMRCGSTADA